MDHHFRTGAQEAFPFGGTFRDHKSGGLTPVRVIHSDLSPDGATWMKEYVQEELASSGVRSKIDFAARMSEGADVVILKVWRPVLEVRRNHMGICKWDSLLEEDALPWKIKPNSGQDALQPWKYRNGQQWFYASNQKPDEVFVMMQHDSTAPGGHGMNVPHGAFNLQGHQSTFSRPSYETSVIAIINDPRPSAREKIISSLFGSKFLKKVRPGTH